VTVDPYKKISPNLKKYSPTIIRTANRFEVLHNLNDDGTQVSSYKNNKVTNADKATSDNLGSVSTSSDKIILNKTKRKPLMNNCENSVTYTGSVYNNRTNKANNHNIMILGYSHLQGSAIGIGGYLGEKFEVSGMIKPGASVTDIVAQTNMNNRSLTKNYVIVIHGGSNDVYRNNSKVALLQIVKFIQDINNTNIIVLRHTT
jgi:hypothetical protein